MLQLKNFMEDIVLNLLDDTIKSVGVCDCEECKLDIVAKAMNNLPPQYFVVNQGTPLSKLATLQLLFEDQVKSTLTDAALLVKSNPRHNCSAPE